MITVRFIIIIIIIREYNFTYH